MLGFKCNPNIKNSANNIPLHLSAKNGYFDISKKLLEFGAELNSENSEKNSPLHYVCENNYIELLKYFLTKNPKVNEKNIYGKTPKDLTTNSEIKNLLDVYIRENDKKINNNDTCEKLENKYSKDDINISKVKNKKNKKKREYIVHPKNIIRLESDNHINDIININGKENKRSQSRENKVKKIFDSKHLTFDSNGNIINFKPYKLDRLKKEFTLTKNLIKGENRQESHNKSRGKKRSVMSLKSKKKESLIEDEKGKELLIEKPEVLFEEKTTRERERFLPSGSNFQIISPNIGVIINFIFDLCFLALELLFIILFLI